MAEQLIDEVRRLRVLAAVADTVTHALSLDRQLPRLIDLIIEAFGPVDEVEREGERYFTSIYDQLFRKSPQPLERRQPPATWLLDGTD